MKRANNVRTVNLARLPLVRTLLVSRWPQFLAATIALAGFVFAITAGLVGAPVGSRNFAIVFVWIAWWALLMLIIVPFFGRAWCSLCPIPMPGEWIQRGALLKPRADGRGLSLGRRWPGRLRSIWLQNIAFALVALFSTVVLTHPRVTSIVLLAFLFVAIAASLIFERRAFCRYLCPVGGFIGLYSQLAPLEVRAVDPAVCAAHKEKTCYTGSEQGYGCPWQVFTGSLVKNTYCGMCMECLRTCPHDNVAINLRPFGDDLQQPKGRKLDEVYKAFIMLGSALLYSAVLLGPWGALKMAAYSVGTLPWVVYALTFLTVILVVLPGLFYLAVRLGLALSGSTLRPKAAFTSMAYSLAPLGLMAWVAFSLSFVFANFSYIWPALSDPLGWGWDLFGTANVAWQPYLMDVVPLLQALVLGTGLVWSVSTARAIAGEKLAPRLATLQAAPVAAYCMMAAAGLMGLLI